MERRPGRRHFPLEEREPGLDANGLRQLPYPCPTLSLTNRRPGRMGAADCLHAAIVYEPAHGTPKPASLHAIPRPKPHGAPGIFPSPHNCVQQYSTISTCVLPSNTCDEIRSIPSPSDGPKRTPFCTTLCHGPGSRACCLTGVALTASANAWSPMPTEHRAWCINSPQMGLRPRAQRATSVCRLRALVPAGPSEAAGPPPPAPFRPEIYLRSQGALRIPYQGPLD